MWGAPRAYTRSSANPQATGRKVVTGRSPQPETAPEQHEHGKDDDSFDGKWSGRGTVQQAKQKLDVQAFIFGIGFRHGTFLHLK